jgi:prolyl 4-hydroxylase
MEIWMALSILLLSLGCFSAVGQKYETTRNTSIMETIDADARIFVWHHFLSDDECDYIRQKAEKRLERSGVVDTGNGGSQISDIRTSDGMFFTRAENEVIEAIEKRLSDWTLTPVHAGEGLQVLRYRRDQKYDAHWDYFFDKVNAVNGGNRYATVLMYLAAAEEGGETVFPKIPAPNGINPDFSDCAKYSLAVKPKKGDAILFHSMNATGDLEERSMHGACPVLKGEKWSMTKWIHGSHYNMGGDKYDLQHQEYTRLLNTFKAGNHAKEL